jgi:hypothetical protein
MEEGSQEGASYFRLSALSVMSGCLTWVVFHSSLGMIAWFAVVGAVCLGSLALFAMRVCPLGGVHVYRAATLGGGNPEDPNKQFTVDAVDVDGSITRGKPLSYFVHLAVCGRSHHRGP